MISQADFARLAGVSKQMVSKYKRDGRLEIVGGLVDAAASLARLEGVLDEEKRRAALKKLTAAPAPIVQPAPAKDDLEARIAALTAKVADRTDKQRRERVEADKAELEFLTLTGRLIDAAEVRKAIEDAVSTFWSEIQRRERDDSDQLASRLRLDAAQSRTLRAELHKRDHQMRRDFAGALGAIAQAQPPALHLVSA